MTHALVNVVSQQMACEKGRWEGGGSLKPRNTPAAVARILYTNEAKTGCNASVTATSHRGQDGAPLRGLGPQLDIFVP